MVLKKKKDVKCMDRQMDILQFIGLLKIDVNFENNLVKIIYVILQLCIILKNVQEQNFKNKDFKGI